MTERRLDDFAAYLFDADGTLMYPGRLVPGADRVLAALKAAGKRVLVVTNNSRQSRQGVVETLNRLGIPIDADDVFTAVTATAQYVARELAGARVYALGSAGLTAELRAAGVHIVESEPVDGIVVGTDLELTYAKVIVPLRALLAGARFIAVNVDPIIPDPAGPLPGTAFLVGGLAAMTGRAPDIVIGKPSTVLLLEALERLGIPAADCLFVGDSLDTDVVAARAVGMRTLLVLTGTTDERQLAGSAIKPDYVLASIADLLPALAACGSCATPGGAARRSGGVESPHRLKDDRRATR